MLIEESIKFKVGDIVTDKEFVNSPLGTWNTPDQFATVYEVKGYYVDNDWNNRTGVPGNCHTYLLKNIFNGNEHTRLQYEICFASERIDNIFESAKKYFTTLSNLRDILKNAKNTTN